MILWRISEHGSLDGGGGLIVAGRWHSKGRRIVYTADSSALAMLEVLVHLERDTVPESFRLLKIEVPDELAATRWTGARLPPSDETGKWGDAWLEKGATPLAAVPSIVAPGGFNWLINPSHPDARRVKRLASSRQPWDRRLFGVSST
ncbi:MAG: RES family NAD+ phosphorylase [Sphingomonadaceae bacterium]